MHNFLMRIVCCFIPKKEWRRALRAQTHHYSVTGTGNRIFVGGQLFSGYVNNMRIEIRGNNNTIYLPSGARFEKCHIRIVANNVSITIEDSIHRIAGLFINCCCGDSQHLHIGRNFHCHGVSVQLNEEKAALEIGDNCLFSSLVDIWPTDGHAIIDCASDEILNPISSPVQIGNHCWIGQGVRILKNAHIPSNTIVGGGSVVCKKFTSEYCALAGNPARVVRQGVTWDNKTAARLEKYRKENQNEQ